MKYILYYRVSTNKQGVSGLGLEAQEQQVQNYLLLKSDVEIIGTFTEVDSGRKANRIELNKAVALAKKNKATLLVAKLDRIARNVRLFLELLDTVNIEFTDLPNLGTGTDARLVLTQLSAFAEWEASKISERTKAAFAAKKKRGEAMGGMGTENIKATNGKRKELADDFAISLAPMLIALSKELSQRKLVEYLNKHQVKSPNGGEWGLSSLQNVLKRTKTLVKAHK